MKTIIPLIEAKNLSKSYGSHLVLKNFNFNIYPGQIIGLIGENGVGKSTLLRILLGIIPCEGQLQVLGYHPYTSRSELVSNCSSVIDSSILPKNLRVSEIIEIYKLTHPSFNIHKAQTLLLDTKISLNSKIAVLSKGQKAFVYLAMALSIEVPLMILDEPTLGLDIIIKEKFYATLIKEYCEQGRTIIISSHQVDELESILTRVLYIKDQELLLDRLTQDLLENYTILVQDNTSAHLSRILTENILYEFKKPNGRRLLFKRDLINLQGLEENLESPSFTELFTAMHYGVKL